MTIPATTREYRPQIATYRVVDALRALAERLDFLAAEEPSLDAAERIMTTAEMVAEGVRLEGGHANFAIRVAEAIELPEADLPVDPYAVGAWLGDGSAGSAEFVSMDEEIVAGIESSGHDAIAVATVGAALFHVFGAVKTHAAVAAVARRNLDIQYVTKCHL